MKKIEDRLKTHEARAATHRARLEKLETKIAHTKAMESSELYRRLWRVYASLEWLIENSDGAATDAESDSLCEAKNVSDVMLARLRSKQGGA